MGASSTPTRSSDKGDEQPTSAMKARLAAFRSADMRV
jgi:hypothetical protein